MFAAPPPEDPRTPEQRLADFNARARQTEFKVARPADEYRETPNGTVITPLPGGPVLHGTNIPAPGAVHPAAKPGGAATSAVKPINYKGGRR